MPMPTLRYLREQEIEHSRRIEIAFENMKVTQEPRKKVNYVGAPATFALDQACAQISQAFDGYACYLVGSAIQRPDWRDVDVRFIMEDSAFAALFPDAGGHWEQDPRWLLLVVSISQWLSKLTGLPIDFQFQPQTHANEKHKGPRYAIGIRIAKEFKE
jgi:hypothetical protein